MVGLGGGIGWVGFHSNGLTVFVPSDVQLFAYCLGDWGMRDVALSFPLLFFDLVLMALLVFILPGAVIIAGSHPRLVTVGHVSILRGRTRSLEDPQ